MNKVGQTKLLILGQTPPPYHGQALSIERLVRADLKGVTTYHVRLAFSSSLQSVGRFEWTKVLHLGAVVLRALVIRFRYGVTMLYLPPAGPQWIPVLRDVVLLLALRRVYGKVIYHFHAAGLSTFLQAQPPLLRYLIRKVYARPAGAIQISRLGPPDAEYVHAKHVAVIPLGVEDAAGPLFRRRAGRVGERVSILYVGAMVESKGIMVLLEAIGRLIDNHLRVDVSFMGQFASVEFEQRAREYCRTHGLLDAVSFVGQKVAPEKWEYFRRADIFCFPSFYESEAFPHVVIEAMMFGLPVVATRWRAIPEMVDDGVTGYLVPIEDATALAEALCALAGDAALRGSMGLKGRGRYVQEFTLEKYLERIGAFFREMGER